MADMEGSDEHRMVRRLAAVAIAASALIAAVTTALHPPIIDPGAHQAVAHAVAEATELWVWIHWLAAAGFTLWRLGFVALHVFFARALHPVASTTALGLSWMAGGLWLGLLVFEAAALPLLAAAPFSDTDLFAALWSATIITGFVATGMDGLATALWGTALLATDHERADSPTVRTGWSGVGAGGLLAAAAGVALASPGLGLLALGAAGVGFLLWSYRAAALLWYTARAR